MSPAKNFRWYGDKYKATVLNTVGANIARAALFLEGNIKKAFPSGPTPSESPNIPHVQSGHFRRTITAQKSGPFTWQVGSSLKPLGGQSGSYALYLEEGTSKMKKRPWLRPALDRNHAKLVAMLTKKVKG